MTAQINGSAKMGLRGEFKCILWNEDGTKALETDWHSNLITNNGLLIYGGDNYTVTSWHTRCYLGDSSTAPAITDTQLGNIISGDRDSDGNAYAQADYPRPPVAPDWERWSGKRYRFNAGNGTGTVREIGIGMRSATDLFCRHVLPVPIPKAANQALDVFYKHTLYIDSTPQTGQVVLDGVTYDWTIIPIARDTYNYSIFQRQGLSTSVTAYDENNVSGGDTSYPSGGGSDAGGATGSVTAWGQGYEDLELTFPLGGAVTPTGKIRYMVIRNATYHRWQITFAAVDGPDIGGPIPKAAEDVMIMTFRLSWDRYTP